MPPEVGDEVVIDAEAVAACPEYTTFHRRACTEGRGEVYAMTPSNGGPEAGHGLLVALNCPHRCAAAMAFGELSRG